MRTMKNKIVLLNLIWFLTPPLAAEHFEMLPYGSMDEWVTRHITESKILGGQTKTLYAIGPTETIVGNIPFEYGQKGNPWSVSNAYARVLGIDKTSGTTRPEKRGDGYCARMDCKLESMTALKIDLKLQIAGTIFTGKTYEPVPLKAANDPYRQVDFGMPFTRRPIALQCDYKARIEDSNIITYAKATPKPKLMEGRDCGKIVVYLQHRWEDQEGNIYAYRIGTGYELIWNDIPDWVNGHRVPIRYGDIKTEPNFQDYEDLNGNLFRTMNSKGEMKYINEVAFKADAEPTHLIILFSSGNMEAFVGHDGNTLWVDNVGLIYED